MEGEVNLAPQLSMLYYMLLYEVLMFSVERRGRGGQSGPAAVHAILYVAVRGYPGRAEEKSL